MLGLMCGFCEAWPPWTPGPGTSSSVRSGPLPGGWSQMLRAAKVFTRVTCALVSVSLGPLLLSRALCRCRSSWRFFFSSRCCSFLCLFVTFESWFLFALCSSLGLACALLCSLLPSFKPWFPKTLVPLPPSSHKWPCCVRSRPPGSRFTSALLFPLPWFM